MTRRTLPAVARNLAGLLAAVLLLGACADVEGGSPQPSTTAVPGIATTESPATGFPDHVEPDELLSLSDEQLAVFIGMTEEAGRAFAEDRGFTLKVAGPGHEAMTMEACVCVYARSDADGTIVSVID